MQFYATLRQQLERLRGREIDSAGDGAFATFDGPARAVGTVKDLVAGSGLRFAERSVHTLKGAAGAWRLYAAEM